MESLVIIAIFALLVGAIMEIWFGGASGIEQKGLSFELFYRLSHIFSFSIFAVAATIAYLIN